MASKRRRIDVDATSSRRIDVNMTSFRRCVPAECILPLQMISFHWAGIVRINLTLVKVKLLKVMLYCLLTILA